MSKVLSILSIVGFTVLSLMAFVGSILLILGHTIPQWYDGIMFIATGLMILKYSINGLKDALKQ